MALLLFPQLFHSVIDSVTCFTLYVQLTEFQSTQKVLLNFGHCHCPVGLFNPLNVTFAGAQDVVLLHVLTNVPKTISDFSYSAMAAMKL